MRASNRDLKKVSDPKNYTVTRAKKLLQNLGIENDAVMSKKYRFYVKKASEQDAKRTPVVNKKAADMFFDVSLPKRGDETTITLKYLPGGNVDTGVVIRKKQDIRIYFNKGNLKETDLLLFESTTNGFTLEILNKATNKKRYKTISSGISGTYLLTNTLPSTHSGTTTSNNNDMNRPLNQILFGPPGTGKTYSTVEKSLEILGKLSVETDDVKFRIENREIFKTLLNKRIFFVTMHPSFSYEDFVQGIKPKTENRTLLFEPKNGIFKEVSKLALELYDDEGEISDTDIDNSDILRICFFLSKFNTKTDKKANREFGSESNRKVFATVGDKFKINPNSVRNHRDKFDFLVSQDRVGWKPHNGSSDTLDNSALWPYNDVYLELKDKKFNEVKAIVKSIETKAKKTTKRIEENINYVLILDEINRANISKVFGELITLLEEDKRLGADNELTVMLPSGEVFGVPPNLYIIGTMNTADKSIALVDIALRRRFQFVPVYPNPEIIEKFGKKEKDTKIQMMVDLNTELINSKGNHYKGVDFQIGHSYFLKNNTISEVINENMIPLLTEYFRNDLEKVRNLLIDIGYQPDEDHWKKTGLLLYK